MAQGDIFLERLSKVIDSRDPLSVATVFYQTIRESPSFNQDIDLDDKKKIVNNSIVRACYILRDNYKWELDEIEKFIIHIKGFFEEILDI